MTANPTAAVDVRKNVSEWIRVQLTQFKGYNLADVRVHVEDSRGELQPTRKGISFKRSLLPDVIAALEAVRKADEEEAADELDQTRDRQAS